MRENEWHRFFRGAIQQLRNCTGYEKGWRGGGHALKKILTSLKRVYFIRKANFKLSSTGANRLLLCFGRENIRRDKQPTAVPPVNKGEDGTLQQGTRTKSKIVNE